MDRVGLTSGQVAYRLGVSDGTVRGWTTGRRGIGADDLARFADLVAYPVEYFLRQEYRLSEDFSLRYEVHKLSTQMSYLIEKIAEEPAKYIASDDQALSYLRDTHRLSSEDIESICKIIKKAGNREEKAD